MRLDDSCFGPQFNKGIERYLKEDINKETVSYMPQEVQHSVMKKYILAQARS